MSRHYHDDCEDHKNPRGCGCECCPQGPQGPQGVQGPAGIMGPAGAPGAPGASGLQGVQGPQGPQGLQGLAGVKGDQGQAGPVGAAGAPGSPGAPGSQGPMGQTGANGPQGLQGPVGPVGPSAVAFYANVWSQVDQTRGANGLGADKVLFEGANAVSGFDISTAASSGEIRALQAGVYLINWDANGRLANPFPSPVPAWSFAIFKNGVMVPGSNHSAFTSSPDDEVAHSSGSIIVALAANDAVTLVNTSNVPVLLRSAIPGSLFPVTSAGFSISVA